MTGLHHLSPGGPALPVPLPGGLALTKLSVGPGDNNAYLLVAGEGRLLIDAADEPDRLLELCDGALDTIVTTHRHPDHWQGLARVAERTGARLLAGRPDVDAVATGAWVEDVEGVWDGDRVVVGDQELEVIGLVGHTPGSVALAWRGPDEVVHLFTGDSLFPGGPGKTHGPTDFATLMEDLETKVFDRFDDDAVVHPGHGDATTLGAERPHLAEWRARGW